MKLSDPMTPRERGMCIAFIRGNWWSGPQRWGEKREGQVAPDAQNPEAFHIRRLMYTFADEYEQWAKEKGLLAAASPGA